MKTLLTLVVCGMLGGSIIAQDGDKSSLETLAKLHAENTQLKATLAKLQANTPESREKYEIAVVKLLGPEREKIQSACKALDAKWATFFRVQVVDGKQVVETWAGCVGK